MLRPGYVINFSQKRKIFTPDNIRDKGNLLSILQQRIYAVQQIIAECVREEMLINLKK